MAAPFPIDPHLTSIAIAYRNGSLIADSVLPRVPVGKSEFKWWEYDLADGFTLPNTSVGRTSQPNQVEFNATEETSSTSDYALDSPVPQSDIDNAPKNYDPLGRAAEQVSDLIELDREVRTARTVFSANTYSASNKETVATAAQWDKADSKPVRSIVTALDKMIMRPNVAIFGRSTATALRMNPSVVKAYNGSTGDDGMVPLQFLRDLLELEEILVGSAFVNIARPGQKPQLQRTWANHAAFIYRNKLANTQGGVTFGLTAQFGTRISGSIPDSDMGMRGGQRVRVGESVKELVIAPDVGYFFQNAVAG
ncbi:phage capsid protein [Pectobacterium aroidearum]|uniref:major capsid protein n=1 Tax=Pectobacterium aroidearum TaxID=1201031 RepID=UPI0021155243|nr:phage capsid protein [Pectobacterium aroidearum]UUE71098.1 phage capsid protein [Pectobacterium aroidearum]UUE71514.1 phage capsid protein [Pectobacterium aroidearum]UUE71582.1 phage capsid protein [Pectobacterium aroidearum]UUE75497.1 phage capsid protein [Pectobacterium aroidearum]UUE75914.1 phage capsid protein [Pectobacterium aroidearum]